mmetsp:Transcript_2582/g.6752  ORF Transcript_2582/g.6752 Transcript_2582/m.6752 type:complete len:220 (-) Transcript_2582:309-968(-)
MYLEFARWIHQKSAHSIMPTITSDASGSFAIRLEFTNRNIAKTLQSVASMKQSMPQMKLRLQVRYSNSMWLMIMSMAVGSTVRMCRPSSSSCACALEVASTTVNCRQKVAAVSMAHSRHTTSRYGLCVSSLKKAHLNGGTNRLPRAADPIRVAGTRMVSLKYFTASSNCAFTSGFGGLPPSSARPASAQMPFCFLASVTPPGAPPAIWERTCRRTRRSS